MDDKQCTERLTSIAKEQKETLANYYRTVGATLVTRKKREITDELWQQYEELQKEYAETYSACFHVKK